MDMKNAIEREMMQCEEIEEDKKEEMCASDSGILRKKEDLK